MPPTYQQKNRVTIDGLWLTVFTATLSASLVAALIWSLGAHLYLEWQRNEAMKEIKALQRK